MNNTSIGGLVCDELPDSRGQVKRSASPSPESLSWIQACHLANQSLSQNFSSRPWEGQLPAFIQNSKVYQTGFARLTTKAAVELLSPQAWAPLPTGGPLPDGQSRHIQIPAQGLFWETEAQRWLDSFQTYAPELGVDALWIQAFSVLHEAGHCLHAQVFDGMDQWFEHYLGLEFAPPHTHTVISRIMTVPLNPQSNAVSNSGWVDFVGQMQEGFADCWALLAISGNNPSRCAALAWTIADLRADCPDSSSAHHTHDALVRLALCLGTQTGRLSPYEALDLALSCAQEGAILGLNQRLEAHDQCAHYLAKTAHLDWNDIQLAVSDCSWIEGCSSHRDPHPSSKRPTRCGP